MKLYIARNSPMFVVIRVLYAVHDETMNVMIRKIKASKILLRFAILLITLGVDHRRKGTTSRYLMSKITGNDLGTTHPSNLSAMT